MYSGYAFVYSLFPFFFFLLSMMFDGILRAPLKSADKERKKFLFLVLKNLEKEL